MLRAATRTLRRQQPLLRRRAAAARPFSAEAVEDIEAFMAGGCSTILTEDEEMMRDAVRRFAQDTMGPRVSQPFFPFSEPQALPPCPSPSPSPGPRVTPALSSTLRQSQGAGDGRR
mmetsp:Transcript_26371/g.82133  ORF Transcript_26371/g.82133 Transcript_26371/m.82133 type:complete len:116 (-) Transcript_26371:2347-2694(-)